MVGYRDESRAGAMTGQYYRTGDVARRDDGYITYVGRTDDVFKAPTIASVRSSLRAHSLSILSSPRPPWCQPGAIGPPCRRRLSSSAATPPSRRKRDHLHVRARPPAGLQPNHRIEFSVSKTMSGKIRRVQAARSAGTPRRRRRSTFEFWEEDSQLASRRETVEPGRSLSLASSNSGRVTLRSLFCGLGVLASAARCSRNLASFTRAIRTDDLPPVWSQRHLASTISLGLWHNFGASTRSTSRAP